jgi:hypothetical protein
MGVTCDRCEADVPPNASFCQRCGLRIPALRCYACGEAIYPREDNCSSCGMLQPHAVRQPPIQSAPLPPHAFPPPPPPRHIQVPPNPPVAPPPPPPPVQPARAPAKPKQGSLGCGCLMLILFLILVGLFMSRQTQRIKSATPSPPPGVDWTKLGTPAFPLTVPPSILGTRPIRFADVQINRDPERVTIAVRLDASTAGQVRVAAYLRTYDGKIVPAASNTYMGADGGVAASKVVDIQSPGRRTVNLEIPYTALYSEDRGQTYTLHLILWGTDGMEWSRAAAREFPPQVQYRYR